jgi:hypothetical protein
MNVKSKKDLSIILGRPGTGKTKYLLDLVRATPNRSFVYYSVSKLSKYYADEMQFENLKTCIYPLTKELFLDQLNKLDNENSLILLLDDLHYVEAKYGELAALKDFKYPIYAASMTDKSKNSYAESLPKFADSVVNLDRELASGN